MAEGVATINRSDRLAPAREHELIDRVLREQIRLDQFHLGPVLDLAAVGIVNGAWRNSPVEDWHAEGRPRR